MSNVTTAAARRTIVVAFALLLTGVARSAAAGSSANPPPGAAVQSQQVWAMSRLARADDLLRHNRRRAAARLFMEVFEGAQGTPWAGFAELGLAWSALATGDLSTARFLSGDALHDAGAASVVADVLIALLDGSQGEYANAVNRLTRVLASQPAGGPGHNTVQLARGYVRYWSDDFTAAAADFDAVTSADATGTLADDGRYGAAQARIAAGDRETGIVALREILMRAAPNAGRSPVSEALVDLEPKAVLRESFRRYRKGGVQMPEAQLARLLDFDGVSRARAALSRLEQDPQPSLRPARVASRPVAHGAPPATAAAPDATRPLGRSERPAGAAPEPIHHSAAPPPASTPPWTLMITVAAVVLVALLALTRRLRTDSSVLRDPE